MIYTKWKLHVIKFVVQNKREIADNMWLIFVQIKMTRISNICVITTTFYIKILIMFNILASL